MFKKLPTAPHQIIVMICIVIISLLAYIYEDSLIGILVYERNYIGEGELWRLLTGHFFHSNLNHLLLNLAGLVLLWALHGQHYQTVEYLIFFIFSALFTGVCLYIFSPKIYSYVGLSGVLHGIFIWGVIYDVRKKVPGGYVLLTAVIAKVLYEQIYGAEENIQSLIEAPVAVDAHMWGAISGLLFSLLLWLYQTIKISKAVN
ncbi:rhombosortase [Paraglaciecola sp. L3A3]|uniref:rhombosortase n=1 Tax=Paraglaciecola sp. L3A3 TaxID=2686358 RepID=UPI00131DF8BA|nr:rhombosortase [Paraglaciecola sp. L3A3]